MEFETSQLTVPCRDRRRMDSDQDFIVLRDRFDYFLELKTLWWSILCPYDRLHFILYGLVAERR